jgi:hypothetical protein
MTIRLLEGGFCRRNTGSVVVPLEMVLAAQVVLANERAIDISISDGVSMADPTSTNRILWLVHPHCSM